jgi:hypothetical protein
MTVTETLKGHKVIAINANVGSKNEIAIESRKQAHTHRKVVAVGSARVTLTAGQSRVVRVTLNRTGKALLAKHHTLKVSLRVAQTLANHHTVTVASRTLTFKAPKHHKH